MKFTYLFVIAILCQGCLLKKVVILNADQIMGMQIEKHVPLTHPQKDELSRDTDQFLNQIKPGLQEALPFLQNLKLEKELIESEYNQIKHFYATLSGSFIQLYAKYVARLDPKQQHEFWKRFDDNTTEIKDRSKRVRLERMEDRFEMFFGTANPEQQKILKNLNHHNLKRAPARLEGRAYLKAQLLAAFGKVSTPDEKLGLIQKLYSEYHDGAFDHQHNIEFLKTVSGTLSKKQIKHFNKEMKENLELIKYFIHKKF